MAIAIDAAFPVFFGTDGNPINGGFIYIGEPNLPPQTNQKSIYWDEDLTVPASQPLRIIAGRVARNGSPAMLFTDGKYSIELQDSNANTIYTVPQSGDSDTSTLFTNSRVTRDQFSELAGITPDELAVGEYAYIVSVDSWYVRVSSGGDLDYSGVGGVLLDVLEGPSGYDPRSFGATGDGVADDTDYISSALTKGNITLERGTFKATRAIQAPQESRQVIGSGSGDLIFDPAIIPSDLFTLERTNGVDGRLDFVTVGAVTSTANAGTFALVSETRTAAGPHVVGALDILTFSGCHITNNSGGYWTNVVKAQNAGGIEVDRSTFANFQNTTAQSDTGTAAISIINDDADFSIIRALHWDQSYTQRFNKAVAVEVVSSIESLYLGQGEMVGHFVGLLATGGGVLGATNVIGTHMDCITSNIRAEGGTDLNIMRLSGHDLRLGENGSAFDNLGVNVRIDSGNYINIGDGNLDGAAGATGQRGVSVVNDVPGLSVVNNNFRRKNIAVDAVNVTRANFQGNLFETVITEYSVADVDGVNIDNSKSIDVSEDAYTGNLDGLAGQKKEYSVRRVGAGFTNGPSGPTGSGHVVSTVVWDVNAAHQEFRSLTSPYIFWRSKSSGIWSSWVSY